MTKSTKLPKPSKKASTGKPWAQSSAMTKAIEGGMKRLKGARKGRGK